MKTILTLFFGTGLLIFSFFSFSKSENYGHNGKCTGSAYCTACYNCSRCGHCSAGGTCSVCSGSSSGKNVSLDYPTKSKNLSSHSKKNTSSRSSTILVEKNITPSNHFFSTNLSVTNLYKKPSFQSEIIEEIPKYSELIKLYKLDFWYKVKIKKSGKTGYVYYQDLK